MATSGENKAAGITVDSTIKLTHSSSKQQEFFAKWLQTRDNSIQPPKEPIEQSPCFCHMSGGHERHGVRCPRHYHTVRISNHNLEDQNRAKSAMSNRQTNKKLNRTTSAHSVSSTHLTSSNEQRTSSVTNTESEEEKFNMPIRIPETTLSSSLDNEHATSDNEISVLPVFIDTHHSLLPEQHAVIDHDKPITCDEENHQSFANE